MGPGLPVLPLGWAGDESVGGKSVIFFFWGRVESAGRPIGLGLRSLWPAFALPSRMSVSRPRGLICQEKKRKQKKKTFFFFMRLVLSCCVASLLLHLAEDCSLPAVKVKNVFFPRPPSFPPSPPLFLLGGPC